MSWKKKAVAITLCAACGAIFTLTPARAAIMVMDQKNIGQAIKEYIQTTKVLNEVQKQYALMFLNSKKLDLKEIWEFEKKREGIDEKREAWKKLRIHGIGGDVDTPIDLDKSTTQDVWNERLGDVKGIFEGNKTVYEGYKAEKKRQETLDDMAKQAADKAQAANAASKEVTKDALPKTMEAVNNAEGETQVLQAMSHAEALGVLQQSLSNEILSAYVMMKGADLAADNARRATTKAYDKAQADAADKVHEQMKKNGDVDF